MLARVARLTQADVVTSVDSLVSKPTLGGCRNFSVETFILPDGKALSISVVRPWLGYLTPDGKAL